MNITFNIDSQYAEVHKFSFLQTTALVAMVISGIAFWIAAITVILNPIYQ